MGGVGSGFPDTMAGGVRSPVEPAAPFAGGGGSESEGAGGATPGVTHIGTMLGVLATYSAWPVDGSVTSDPAPASRFEEVDCPGPPAPVSFQDVPFQTQVDV